VAAFQTGRYNDGGASNVGWATSTDGGANWVHGFLPGTTVFASPPGPYQRVSDPVVAYDLEHDVWMVSTLAINNTVGVAVLVNRSTDGGLTWGLPVVVSSKPSGFYDKNWIACDNWATSPFFGNCYTTWDDANLGNRLYNSTSTDGGLTWGPKKATRNSSTGIGGQPLIQPNGRVHIVGANAFGGSIIVWSSANGGGSWTRSRNISNVSAHTVAGGLRAPTYLPSSDVDASGKLYVTWADCRFRSGCSANDIVMTTSMDGISWTPVARIPIDPTTSGVDHFIPGFVADPATSGGTARLALAYYYYPVSSCNSSTCQLSVGFVSSLDGGASWSAPLTVDGPDTLSWIANTTQGRMVGDYISTSFAGPNAVPVWSGASAPSGTFLQHSYANQFAVTAAQEYPAVTAADPVLSTSGDRPVPTSPIVIP
jgi:hypothetical protein